MAVALITASIAVFPPLAAQADSSVLSPGQTLAAGGKLLSPDSHYQLIMQSDGNLVDYSWPRALWASNTAGKSGADLEMQTDGNLVVYAPGHVAVWASNTAGHPGAYLVIQNDANMVVVSPSGQPLWASGAVDYELQPGQSLSPGWQIQSPDRNYRMVMQSDGNLVLYTGNTAKWASGTSVANSDLEMQSDGNLVIYAPGHAAVWASNTAGKNGSVLFGQNDGNFVLYAPGNVAVWSTNTATSTLTPRQQAAIAILNNSSRIALATVHASGVVDKANAKQEVVDTANGLPATRSCYGTAPCGTVWLHAKILQVISGLGDLMTLRVSEIAGGSHSSSASYHYLGLAFDIDKVNGQSVTTQAIAQPVINYCIQEGASYTAFENGNHAHCQWPTSTP